MSWWGSKPAAKAAPVASSDDDSYASSGAFDGSYEGASFSSSSDSGRFEDPFAVSETDELMDLSPSAMDYAPVSSYSPPPPPPPSASTAAAGAGSVAGASKLGSLFSFGSSKPPVVTGAATGDAAPVSNNLSSADVATAAFAGTLALPNFAAAPSRSTAAPIDKHYLSYERRGLMGQASYNAGYSYFGGLALGGLYGMMVGLKNSPNRRARILVNSVLNGSGKYGSRAGNAAGVLAMIYTVLERQYEDMELDRLPRVINNTLGMRIFSNNSRSDFMVPVATAFTTGVLFSLPRAITMKGLEKMYVTPGKRIAVCVSGGVVTTLGVSLLSVLGPALFGERSPFRFAH